MKNSISFISILFCTTVNAQFEKGTWTIVVAGSFGVGFTKGYSDFRRSIQPRAGYFLANKFLVGAGIDFYCRRLGASSITTSTFGTSFSPYIRYYFLKSERRLNVYG